MEESRYEAPSLGGEGMIRWLKELLTGKRVYIETTILVPREPETFEEVERFKALRAAIIKEREAEGWKVIRCPCRCCNLCFGRVERISRLHVLFGVKV